MFRDSARSFANEHLVGRVRKAYTDEIVDTETIPLMGKLGLLGVTLPEKYGGVGANYVSYGLVAREIERIDSGYRSMMSCNPASLFILSMPMAATYKKINICQG